MARLIDVDEAKAFAAECWPKPEYRIGIDALLDNCPTLDPVHAAGACYCNECKFACIGENEAESWCYCKMTNRNINLTDFCSWGQRREDTK